MNRSNYVATSLVFACAAMLLHARSAAAQDSALQFRDGLVTLVARDATVASILDRWAQIGGTTVVNGQTIKGVPVTLQLVDVPERTALAILLRDVGGYILAERPEGLRGVSTIDRILVLPPSAAPIRNPPSQPVIQATFPLERPQISELEAAGDGQTERNDVVVPEPAGLPRTGWPEPGTASSARPGSIGASPMSVGVTNGGARPGEVTTPPPALYRPGATPAVRPGEITAPQPPSRTSPGPPPPEPE
jgi:hypothetical protein